LTELINIEIEKKKREKREKRNLHQKTRYDRRFVAFNDYLSKKCCVACGGWRQVPICLDFHHIDPSTKVDEVSRLLAGRFSTKSIIEEMHKCVILCACCHRLFHDGLIYVDCEKNKVVMTKDEITSFVKGCMKNYKSTLAFFVNKDNDAQDAELFSDKQQSSEVFNAFV
jgi:hypothetical protein